jgi:ubiquitin
LTRSPASTEGGPAVCRIGRLPTQAEDLTRQRNSSALRACKEHLKFSALLPDDSVRVQ